MRSGDRLCGEYGFRDAFSPARDWFARSYLAIDQGPIVVMIENFRSGLHVAALHELPGGAGRARKARLLEARPPVA